MFNKLKYTLIMINIPLFYLEAYAKIQNIQFSYETVPHDHVQVQQMLSNKYKGHFHYPIN